MGYPNNLGNVIFNNGGRYDIVQGQSHENHVDNTWPGAAWMFNAGAFQAPAAYTLGNAARTYGDIRGFPYLNEDLALSKQIHFTERKHLELRVDVLNALNRSVWNNPDTSVTDPQIIQGGRAIGFGSFWGRSNVERQLQLQARFTF